MAEKVEWGRLAAMGLGASLSGTVVGFIRGFVKGIAPVAGLQLDIGALATFAIAAWGHSRVGAGWGRDIVAGIAVGSLALVVEPIIRPMVSGIMPKTATTTPTASSSSSASEDAAKMYVASR